jgi:hypothetical protein
VNKDDIQSVIDDLLHMPDGIDAVSTANRKTTLFIAIQKLRGILNAWESPDSEIEKLRDFAKRARFILGSPYSIQAATWKDASGNDVLVRMIDNKQVLDLLHGQ